MQRGMLTFTQEELQFVTHQLAETSQDVTLLKPKLADAAESNGQVDLLLSEEEAETLLDTLPTPAEAETAIVKKLRTKFQTFLAEARNLETKPKSFLHKLMGKR